MLTDLRNEIVRHSDDLRGGILAAICARWNLPWHSHEDSSVAPCTLDDGGKSFAGTNASELHTGIPHHAAFSHVNTMVHTMVQC